MVDKILAEVAEAARLREGEAGVEAVVREVNRCGHVRLADAARAARLPLPVATAVRRELEKRGLFAREQGLSFTDAGRKWAQESLGLGAPLNLNIPLVPTSLLGEPLDAVCKALDKWLNKAPPANVVIDQAPCTAETAVRRAALLYHSGALEGRRVIFIGDDDSISLACALLGKVVANRPLARRLVVTDIDKRRLDFLQECASHDGLDLQVVEHDLRRPLPNSLIGKFDTFVTDPPYTNEGARLFLSRGVEAIEAGRGYALFSFGHTAPLQRLALQAAFGELGLATSALYPGFNAYEGASILGSRSELYEMIVHAQATEAAQWDGPLYTADVNPRRIRYVCKNCNSKLTLGEGRLPSTIGELKQRGCPKCGGSSFSQLRRWVEP